MLLAQAPVSVKNLALAGINTTEASRVTGTVNNNTLVALPNTHLGFVTKAASNHVPDTAKMNHMQLVLRPSAQRQAALKQLIADQHDPKSGKFRQWLTPQQFGENFGVTDGDIAAVTSWLTSQGFKVNSVYPNKTQIDFSGTAGQVRQAFHTQENAYTINKVKHLANATDIAIPVALKDVVVGVMGLNDFHATAQHVKPKIAQWNASTKKFDLKSAADVASQKALQQVAKVQAATGQAIKPQAINFVGGARGLVPFDLNQMYNANVLRKAGVTGAGVTIAVVEDQDMVPADWTNFVSTFNLTQYNGTFSQINPAPTSGPTNCNDPSVADFGESGETLLDAEWSTAMAPGANIEVASCSDYTADFSGYATTNFFGGVFIAATNLINGTTLPNIISASYGYGEYFTDSTSKTAIDAMWAQADAEGISVFVSTGDSGSNPSFNGGLINGYNGASGVDANSFATSPNVTAVGGTDTADVLDGTTSKYFASTTNAYGGSAWGYVPEIPWNQSCGNGVAAQSFGFSSVLAFCQEYLKYDPEGYYATSEAGSGGPSSVDAKPAWQSAVYDAALDTSRDLPDVALFAGSYGGATWVVTCTSYYPCTPDFSGPVALSGGTSLSSPMFAGIQALIDQGLGTAGSPVSSGNAAPTLYALAGQEYGTSTSNDPVPTACASTDPAPGNISGCVFHNITRSAISSQCYQPSNLAFTTANCYYYGTVEQGAFQLGLTTRDAAPTSYTVNNRAFGARPGWSFASGLGSVNAANLLAAWKIYAATPPPTVAATK
ncbi:hypothetical protein B0E46_11105 [Rhodanobacter sp. B04]|uniref:S53 family peptidase n=1 Tax=Rhodanobacter sp. B04 TaxID=1945860 RepID=UPI0009C9B03B|nr:S53 family peptidase [Rhodanobacter sp. B04]OOG62773.1 hypothetical protein B0E46_11105 [Rhodanobacter sp. B04]